MTVPGINKGERLRWDPWSMEKRRVNSTKTVRFKLRGIGDRIPFTEGCVA